MKKILDASEMSRTLKRMTHEILEKNNGVSDIIFAGVVTRGVPIAARISKNIEQMENVKVQTIPLDITRFRDDIDLKGESVYFSSKSSEYDVHDKTVIIVDDVMYTGRTARAAMEAVLALGRPKRIQLLVLIDRGHRELPIKPDYVGKNIPTSRDERVMAKLFEEDGVDLVAIEE